jgi:hypothetical protein
LIEFWNRLHYLLSFNAQILMQIDDVSKVIKHSKIWNGFFFPNMHHFFFKFEKNINLMIKREKRNWNWRNSILQHILNTFGSNLHLILKITKFENISSTKVIHLYDRKHECIIYMMYDQCIVKRYLNLEHNSKLGVKNAKFGLID